MAPLATNSSSSLKPVGSGSRHSSFDDQTPTTSVIAGQQPTAIPLRRPRDRRSFLPAVGYNKADLGHRPRLHDGKDGLASTDATINAPI